MRKMYDTGDYIVVAPFDHGWEIVQSLEWVDFTLIHNKHREVLDHVLSGGEVEYYNDGYMYVVSDFIKGYNDELDYRIILTAIG